MHRARHRCLSAATTRQSTPSAEITCQRRQPVTRRTDQPGLDGGVGLDREAGPGQVGSTGWPLKDRGWDGVEERGLGTTG